MQIYMAYIIARADICKYKSARSFHAMETIWSHIIEYFSESVGSFRVTFGTIGTSFHTILVTQSLFSVSVAN